METTASAHLITAAQAIAAAASEWVESAPLERLCRELSDAVVGRPRTPGSDALVLLPPTADTSASFENDVFALRAYCRCDGEFHGRDASGVLSCPANFEYFEDGTCVIRGEWFSHLGMGTVFTAAPSVEEVARIREACLRSLDG